MSSSLQSPEFDRMVTLRDSYRAMEAFVLAYLARGDGSVSDFLHTYASSSPNGTTTDPAAALDYLAALQLSSAGANKQLFQEDRLDAWSDGSAICVVSVGTHGDPLDLGEEEVIAFVEKLQDCLNQAQGHTP